MPLTVLGFVLLAIGGWPLVNWAIFLRVVLGLHATWLVNSATHMWGQPPVRDERRLAQLWWVALLTFGEGWHNNHHAHPTSARHGLAWYEFDPTWLELKMLRPIGLVWDVRVARISQTPEEGWPPSVILEGVRQGMRSGGRRKSIAFFIVLGVGLVGGPWRSTSAGSSSTGGTPGCWFAGILVFPLIITGVVLNTIFLVREIRRNEQHEAFINAVTHELKTPVASMRLYLQTLQNRQIDAAKRQEFYQRDARGHRPPARHHRAGAARRPGGRAAAAVRSRARRSVRDRARTAWRWRERATIWSRTR